MESPRKFAGSVFVLMKSVLLNLLCVCILFLNASSHSCFGFLLLYGAILCSRADSQRAVGFVGSVYYLNSLKLRPGTILRSHDGA